MGAFSIQAGTTPFKAMYTKPGTDIFKIKAIAHKDILAVFVNDDALYFSDLFPGKKDGKVSASVKDRGK